MISSLVIQLGESAEVTVSMFLFRVASVNSIRLNVNSSVVVPLQLLCYLSVSSPQQKKLNLVKLMGKLTKMEKNSRWDVKCYAAAKMDNMPVLHCVHKKKDSPRGCTAGNQD